jgi:hypothetical protein
MQLALANPCNRRDAQSSPPFPVQSHRPAASSVRQSGAILHTCERRQRFSTVTVVRYACESTPRPRVHVSVPLCLSPCLIVTVSVGIGIGVDVGVYVCMSACMFVRMRARVCACVRACLGSVCACARASCCRPLCATNAGVSVRVSQRLDRASLCLGQSICSRESERHILPRLAAGSRRKTSPAECYESAVCADVRVKSDGSQACSYTAHCGGQR